MFTNIKSERQNSSQLRYLYIVVFIYFFLNALTQFITSKTADLDQSEQFILSQTLAFGYGAQPPLYTYIVYLLFKLTGPTLATLLALKAMLLSFLVWVFITTGKVLKFTLWQQLIMVASVVFIPQFIWESQRDLTHSVLATTIAATTLLQIIRTEREKSIENYMLLGLLIGVGLISKYNYAIFIVSLFFSLLLVSPYRLILFNPQAIIALLIAMIISTPHILWAVNNPEIAMESTQKLQQESGNLWTGLNRAGISAIAFLSPLWIFATILLTGSTKNKLRLTAKFEDGRFLLILLVVILLIIGLFVTVTGAQQIKDRWYQPLLFFIPIVVGLFSESVNQKLKHAYLYIAVFIALIVSMILPARTIFADTFNKFSRPNFPYPALIQMIENSINQPSFVIAETNLAGGNARPFFPKAVIHVPKYRLDTGSFSGKGLILCETKHCDDEKFKKWLNQKCGIDINALVFNQLEAQYFYAPSHQMSMDWSTIELSTPCKL